MCGICMDKVWDKPEAERIFGILPNCTHAHCLGCLRTWRKSRQDFPLDVIKSVPGRGQQGGKEMARGGLEAGLWPCDCSSLASCPTLPCRACPQCRVHSSYIIPHKFWVSKGAEKEQLIRNFKARTR